MLNKIRDWNTLLVFVLRGGVVMGCRRRRHQTTLRGWLWRSSRWRSCWRRTWVLPCNIFKARGCASCRFLWPPPSPPPRHTRETPCPPLATHSSTARLAGLCRLPRQRWPSSQRQSAVTPVEKSLLRTPPLLPSWSDEI